MLSCELENFSQIFQLFSHQHSPREHFDFRSRFLCFQTANQKIRINSKILCLQSPSILVPRPRRLRDEKRAMGTRMVQSKNRARPMAARLKNKPRAEQEPRSAHGRAVKKNKPRAEQEPRSAHGRAVKKNKPRAEQEPRSAHGRAVNEGVYL